MANITMTEEQFAQLLATLGGKPAANPAFETLTDDEKFAAMLDSRAGNDRPKLPTESVDAKSYETGATFRAFIVRGVVAQLEDYTYPVGYDIPQAEGGLLPNGLPHLEKDGTPNMMFKQHVWESYFQRDIRNYVGKPLPSHVRVDK